MKKTLSTLKFVRPFYLLYQKGSFLYKFKKCMLFYCCKDYFKHKYLKFIADYSISVITLSIGIN
jgi:hypothetical protein